MADLSKFLVIAKHFFMQRVFLYTLIIISSLFVLAPLGKMQTNFSQNCLLYADVVYENYTSSTSNTATYFLFRTRFGAKSVCLYNIVIAAIFSLAYAVAMILGYTFLYRKETSEKTTDLGNVYFLLHCVAEIAVTVMMLVSACLISAGFAHLCKGITNTNSTLFRVDRCSDAQTFNWRDLDGHDFHVCLSVAMAGAWFQFVFWLMQAAFGTWKLWRLNMLPVLPTWLKSLCGGSE